jgi:hypothetical protein
VAKNNKTTLAPENSAPDAAASQERVWIRRGDPDCVHYWVGTGARAEGRERFECGRCGAAMSEPLELAPAERPEKAARRGFVSCDACGEMFHWARTVRNPVTGYGRICLGCLASII